MRRCTLSATNVRSGTFWEPGDDTEGLKMQVEAILFDKDGTLFDFEATWGAAMASYINRVAPVGQAKETAQALGYDMASGRFDPTSVAIAGTAADIADAAAPITGLDTAELIAIIDDIAGVTVQVPAVDLVPCLTALRDISPLGIVTNDSEVPARMHIDGAGIAPYFDFLSGFDSGHGVKPDPGPCLAGARALGARPEATLMVGDSLHDLHAGRAAGMGTVAVLTGVAPAEVLAPFADVVLPDISALADWIASA